MRKELKSVMDNINKKFGMNAVRPANELEQVKWRISSGSVSADIALGGGIPIGRMTQISGGFSASKSAFAYHVAANAQKMRKKKVIWEKYSTKDKQVYHWVICDSNDPEGMPLVVAIIQSESHSYTNEWAGGIGVDTDTLVFVMPEGMEEGLEIASQLQQSGEIDVIIHDSYAAYKPVKAIDTSMEETYQMGLKPKLFDDYHGKYQAFNNRAEREGRIPCTLIAINQLREKIGAYGDPEYEPGGRSIGFTMSVNLRLRRGDWITIGTGENKQIIGQVVKFKTHKNKTYKPQQTGEFDFYFSEGGIMPPGRIDNAKELIIEAMCYGIIERRGAWFYYNGNQLAQGQDNTIALIREQSSLFEEIKSKVMKIAFDDETEVEREDVFGTDALTPEDLIADEDELEVVVADKKPAKPKGRRR